MYNGIGLKTPRGSGTNGYVQKNTSFLARSKERAEFARDEENESKAERLGDRHGNPEILEHERRHRIEVKCAELRDMMEEEGYSEDIISDREAKFRKALLERESVRMFGKRKIDTAINKKLRDAFGIKDEVEEEEKPIDEVKSGQRTAK